MFCDLPAQIAARPRDEAAGSRLDSWPYVSVLSSVGTLTGSSLDGPPGSVGGLADIAQEVSSLSFKPPLLVTLAAAAALATAVVSGPLIAHGASASEYESSASEEGYAEQADGGYSLTEDDMTADPASDSMWNDFDATEGAGSDLADAGFGDELLTVLEGAGEFVAANPKVLLVAGA